MKKIILSVLLFLLSISFSYAGDTIKIMPVGNSITAGEHYHFPALEERTGYRKDLYEMLIDDGYNVDFVGSQTHGIRPVTNPNWYDWNNEAYPGGGIVDIAEKVKVALGVYKPDILLVHIGTNRKDWSSKPGQVMEMLDSINKYSVENNHPMTVFLCKIIRFYITYDSGPISKYNNDVADLVAARTGDKIKIIMVDMENGAGLDYTDDLTDSTADPPYEGGDMWGYTYPDLVGLDKYHPNDKGNTKMAVKFYEELVKELGEPNEVNNHGMNQQPQQFELYQNYPNPFNPTTTFQFELPESGYYSLKVYNSLGQEVVSLFDCNKSTGKYSVNFDASNLASGIYIYRLSGSNVNLKRKMLLLK